MVEESIKEALISLYSPVVAVINTSGEILYFQGEWKPYIGTSVTQTGQRFVDLLPESARLSFASCLQQLQAMDNSSENLSKGFEHKPTLNLKLTSLPQGISQVSATPTHLIEIKPSSANEGFIAHAPEKLRLAMQTSKMGAFEYHLLKKNTEWDPMLKRIWGFPEDASVEQEELWSAIHPDDFKQVEKAFFGATDPAGNGKYFSRYRVIRHGTGETVWVEASGQAIFENGVATKVIGMVLDVTDYKTLENSLQNAIDQFKRADRSKNNFISVLGHELRNPLGAISNGIELLARDKGPKEDTIKIMRHGVETMSRLMDDLLDLNRVSQNEIKLVRRVHNLKDIVQSALLFIQKKVEFKNQRLTVKLEDDIFIDADAHRIEQVFGNLLSNAVRYTPELGWIELETKSVDGRVVICVRDNGIGLDESDIEHVFDPFFQVKPGQKVNSGLGIGLALSKKLVTLHGGKIEAHSGGVKEGGCEFLVYLPLAEKGAAQTEAKQESRGEAIRAGIKVLLIEDNEDILKTFPILLSHLGCDVQVARTGQEGLEQYQKYQPDLALVDLGLPDMSGYQVAEHITKLSHRARIVAVSGYSHKAARERSKESGFHLHMAKPLTMPQIRQLLSEVE